MNKTYAATILLLSIARSLYGSGPIHDAAKPIRVSSPDKKVIAEVSASNGTLVYRITVDGRQVLAPSRLGIEADNVAFGSGVTLGAATSRRIDERYKFFGAHAEAINQANETTIAANSHGEPYFVDVHVANDGVGVRLRLPAKAARKVQADNSRWKLEGDPKLWAAKLDNSYESEYHTATVTQLGGGMIGMPITARVGDVYVTLTEALVKDYGDLALKSGIDGALEGQLYADATGWTTDHEVVQPWRVTIVARNLSDLVNTTLVENLNPPASAELTRADWIKPGRAAWQWLAIGDPREEDQHQWVDWTNRIGFEYYLIDEGWEKWPDSWAAVASDVAYAKTKNVKIWIWVHSRYVRDPQERKVFFRKAHEAGVVGVKIDFPPPASRSVANWYFETAKDAADTMLLVDFHGANKPSGMDRTWPNVLTREGVRGHEYQITRYTRRLPPDHDVILPFTRYIAGPADYTPTVFTPSELQGNTWGHELAQAILFTSPFLCFGGHPESYLNNPARDLISAIPPVWDETRVLQGSEPGHLVAEARRSGDQWFVAVMSGSDATSLDIPLNFLRAGSWTGSQFHDDPQSPHAWKQQSGSVTHKDTLHLELGPRGGFVGWFRQSR